MFVREADEAVCIDDGVAITAASPYLDLAALERGERGELCTRGYSVMLGYWNDQDRTDEAVDEEGWMHTGDLGYLDEDGYLYLGDRRSDMILTGGRNVYPAEVEAALEEHPAVRSVAVIGLPDEDLGQRVHAVVEAAADIEALRTPPPEESLSFTLEAIKLARQELDGRGLPRRVCLRRAARACL